MVNRASRSKRAADGSVDGPRALSPLHSNRKRNLVTILALIICAAVGIGVGVGLGVGNEEDADSSSAGNQKPNDANTKIPSSAPSIALSIVPTFLRSTMPSSIPTLDPSHVPSPALSLIPSSQPYTVPTVSPSASFSIAPSATLSDDPSSIPTIRPSLMPSISQLPSVSSQPSEQPSSEFFGAVVEYLTARSPTIAGALQDPKSAQSWAIKWLLEEDTYGINFTQLKNDQSTQLDVSQRFAAASLWYSTNSNGTWVNSENWMTSANICNWYGLGCGFPTESNGNGGRYRRLNLPGNGRRGVPRELIDSIDPFYEATVISINLEENGLSTSNIFPDGILLFDHLETLNLERNDIIGDLPTGIGHLTSLLELRMARNKIRGKIPTEIGSLVKMKTLRLHRNDFSGSLPHELTRLFDLETLRLEYNLLTGHIPNNIGDMGNLVIFQADNNKRSTEDGSPGLSGTLPASISQLTSITDIHLHSNSISGTIPTVLGVLNDLEDLFLDENALNGTIPSELAGIDNLDRLYLTGNLLEGYVPNVFCLKGLQVLEVDCDVLCTCCDNYDCL